MKKYVLLMMDRAQKQTPDEKDRMASKEAGEQFSSYWPDALFVAGLALYASGGDKTGKYHVRLSSTNPEIVSTFVKFLGVFAPEYKERVWISLAAYGGTEREGCERFWSEKIKAPKPRFHKTVFLKSRGIERKSPHGICTVGVSSVVLKRKIMVWIDEWAKKLYP